jgi:hypothetical protein
MLHLETELVDMRTLLSVQTARSYVLEIDISALFLFLGPPIFNRSCFCVVGVEGGPPRVAVSHKVHKKCEHALMLDDLAYISIQIICF